MIAVVTIDDLGIHEMDVKLLFFQGEIFYMNNPFVLINLELSIKFVNCYTPHMVLNNPLTCGMNVSIFITNWVS